MPHRLSSRASLIRQPQGLLALLLCSSAMTAPAAMVSCRMCSRWRRARQSCSLCEFIPIIPWSCVPVAEAVRHLEMQTDALFLVRADLLEEQDSVDGLTQVARGCR